jgi:hypothetical protein
MWRAGLDASSVGVLCLAAVLLSGCHVTLSYQKTGERYRTNMNTGHNEIVISWRYGDGSTTETVQDVTLNGNDTRRAEPPKRGEIFDPF